VVQGVVDWEGCDTVGKPGGKYCWLERSTGRSACATETQRQLSGSQDDSAAKQETERNRANAKDLSLAMHCYCGTGGIASATGFRGIGVGRKITTAGGRADGGLA
jgi:hypothetical protein